MTTAIESLIAKVDEVARLRAEWDGLDWTEGAKAYEIWSALEYAAANLDWQSLSAVLRELREDAERLDYTERECLTVRCVDIPTGAGDADVGYEVVSYHMAEPYARIVGAGPTPRAAIDRARNVKEEGR
jgi:hypothetical protein